MAAVRVTGVQRQQFLDHVRDGLNRAEAAAKVGLTGSKFRALCNQDRAFNDLYEQARAEGRVAFQDTVRQSWHTRALEGKNDRLLWYLVVSTLPEAAWFKTGAAPANADTQEQHVDYSSLSTEELVTLKQLVAKAKPPADAQRRGLRAV